MESCVGQELHRTHRDWISENGLRRDEVRSWQYELYQMKIDLPRLQAAIDFHEGALAEHAKHVRLYDLRLSEKEHIVAAGHAEQLCEDLPALSRRVEAEENEHLKQADQHELLKQHHYDVMRHWLSLMKVFSQCNVPPQG